MQALSDHPSFQVMEHVKLFKSGCEGGSVSGIEHTASVEGPQSTTPKNLLRLSIGLEDVGDLITDLERALDAAHAN